MDPKINEPWDWDDYVLRLTAPQNRVMTQKVGPPINL